MAAAAGNLERNSNATVRPIRDADLPMIEIAKSFDDIQPETFACLLKATTTNMTLENVGYQLLVDAGA